MCEFGNVPFSFFFSSLFGNEGKVTTLARGDEGVASVIDEDQQQREIWWLPWNRTASKMSSWQLAAECSSAQRWKAKPWGEVLVPCWCEKLERNRLTFKFEEGWREFLSRIYYFLGWNMWRIRWVKFGLFHPFNQITLFIFIFLCL